MNSPCRRQYVILSCQGTSAARQDVFQRHWHGTGRYRPRMAGYRRHLGFLSITPAFTTAAWRWSAGCRQQRRCLEALWPRRFPLAVTSLCCPRALLHGLRLNKSRERTCSRHSTASKFIGWPKKNFWRAVCLTLITKAGDCYGLFLMAFARNA